MTSEVDSGTAVLSELEDTFTSARIGDELPTQPPKPDLRLRDRVWAVGQVPKPSDIRLRCLDPDCRYDGPLTKSHYISKCLLNCLGLNKPHFDSFGGCSPNAESSSPKWTRLLLCDSCEHKQGEAQGFLQLQCTVEYPRIRGVRKKKAPAVVHLFRPLGEENWLERLANYRGEWELSQLQFRMPWTEVLETFFAKLIWRCRLQISCDLNFSEKAIGRLHQWPLNEPYVVWVDIGEVHDDGIAPCAGNISDVPGVFNMPAVEYCARFRACYAVPDHLQIGHVHVVVGAALERLGFGAARADANRVLFGSAPEPLRAILRLMRRRIRDEWEKCAWAAFVDTMRLFHTGGFDAIDCGSLEELTKNFARWAGNT